MIHEIQAPGKWHQPPVRIVVSVAMVIATAAQVPVFPARSRERAVKNPDVIL